MEKQSKQLSWQSCIQARQGAKQPEIWTNNHEEMYKQRIDIVEKRNVEYFFSNCCFNELRDKDRSEYFSGKQFL